MALLDGLRRLVGPDPLLTRTMQDEIAALRAARAGVAAVWRSASDREAMGVPAVYRAITLIANTTGVLTMEVYKAGVRLLPDDTPRLAVRPDPFRTPRVFWRDTAYHLARRGEVWWWVAARDMDDLPLSLLVVDPREVQVEPDPRDLRYPKITWRGKVMPNRDMRQLTLLTDPNNPLRGWGPLQACGSAVSVAVEAQLWAANFFGGGGVPSVVLRSAVDLSDEEAEDLRNQWVGRPSNVPRIVDPTIEEVKEFGFSPQGAQLTDARQFQNGETALMFGIPGTLLEHFTSGASLTYQNVGQEFDKFVRSCLWPNYLEGIEQELSDLLPRAMTGLFNVDGLLRPDIKTRFDVYNIGVPLGVIPLESAQAAEGIGPGSVERRPVPPAPPQALPSTLPADTRMPVLQARTQAAVAVAPVAVEVRCGGYHVVHGRMVPCNRLLGTAVAPYSLWCARCKRYTTSDAEAA